MANYILLLLGFITASCVWSLYILWHLLREKKEESAIISEVMTDIRSIRKQIVDLKNNI
jgi:hypothetical protein